MNLYLLEITSYEFEQMPYDKTHVSIVSAIDEHSARDIAAFNDEEDFWLDPKSVTCKLLVPSQTPQLMFSVGWGSG